MANQRCRPCRPRFLIVGAHAVAFHARPPATKDLDLYIDRSPGNAKRVLVAIRDFLGDDLGIRIEDLSTPGPIVQLEVAPTRIDLMARVAGIEDFESAWSRRVEAVFGDVPAHYIALDDLIRAKDSAGREQVISSGHDRHSSDRTIPPPWTRVAVHARARSITDRPAGCTGAVGRWSPRLRPTRRAR